MSNNRAGHCENNVAESLYAHTHKYTYVPYKMKPFYKMILFFIPTERGTMTDNNDQLFKGFED